MRNAVVIPLNDEESLVITSDNSGGIGTKEQDLVKVPYEVTGYYLFRVAVMECIAAGGKAQLRSYSKFFRCRGVGRINKGCP